MVLNLQFFFWLSVNIKINCIFFANDLDISIEEEKEQEEEEQEEDSLLCFASTANHNNQDL